jgi:hypothetical protein
MSRYFVATAWTSALLQLMMTAMGGESDKLSTRTNGKKRINQAAEKVYPNLAH